MAGSYLKSQVRCPYYAGDDSKRRINCEGLLPGTNASHYFGSHSEQEYFLRRICCGKYLRCPFAAALEEKYKEDV